MQNAIIESTLIANMCLASKPIMFYRNVKVHSHSIVHRRSGMPHCTMTKFDATITSNNEADSDNHPTRDPDNDYGSDCFHMAKTMGSKQRENKIE